MFVSILFLLAAAVSAIEVSVNFVDTAIPSQANSVLVCEALNTLYGGNVTSCQDNDPFDKMNTQELYINIQTATVDAPFVTINQEADISFINSYLQNTTYFVYPEKSRASIVYLPVDQKAYAYAIVSTYVIGGMLLLLLLAVEMPLCCKSRYAEYTKLLTRNNLNKKHKEQGE